MSLSAKMASLRSSMGSLETQRASNTRASAEAVGLFDDFLTALAARRKPILLISGNHDSAERLAFGGRLLAASNVYLSPAFDTEHAHVASVRLADEYGPVAVWPLPFLKPAHVRAALPDAARALALYTEDVRNSRLFDDLFAHMLARKLAALIATPLLKGSGQKASELEQLYAVSIPPAQRAAASERNDRPAEDPWIASR